MKRTFISIFSLVLACLLLILSYQTYLESRRPEKLSVAMIDSLIVKRFQSMSPNDKIRISRENAVTHTISESSPSIVGVHVTQVRAYTNNPFFNDPFFSRFFPGNVYKKKIQSLGSGVIISADGYIVTNSHVLGDNAVEIYVTLSGGRREKAEIVGSDPLTDLALLKINKNNCPYLEFANSNHTLIGEWVVAMGNPFGLFNYGNQPIATVGIISSLHMDFGETKGGQVYQDMIQTDASINSGNSGGALINMKGKLIGINTFIFSGSATGSEGGSVGIGFAIPANRVRLITDELKKSGKIEWDWDLGITGQALTPSLASYYQLDLKKGVIITDVKKDKAGDNAGLQTGDIIISINNQPVATINDIVNTVQTAYLRAGDEINCLIHRNGSDMSVIVKLEK